MVFYVDVTAPSTPTITSGPTHPYSNSSSATFTFQTSDPLGGDVSSGVASFEYSTDDGTTWMAATNTITYTTSSTVIASSSVTLSSLPDGTYTFEVKATDKAGNVSKPSSSYNWSVDTSAPEVTSLTGPKLPYSNSSSPTFTFSASDPTVNVVSSGVSAFQYSTDGGTTWITATNPITYTTSGGTVTASSSVTLSDLPDGPQTFEVEAIDNAGNVSTPSVV